MVRDLTGKRFGRWLVLSRAEDKVSQNGYHEIMWNCICDCGTEKVVRGKSLTRGISESCGCLQREEVSQRARKHGGFGTRLYAIWNSMRQRCNNKNHHAYANYGGRGIKICDEWDSFDAFRKWAEDAGYKDDAPRGQYTLDRIDVNGDYSPDNCRFITMSEQSLNKRNTIIVEINGEKRPLKEWSEITGIDYHTLFDRYKRGESLF